MKKNIVLIGMPGCGKTTIGKELASKLGYEFCDIDEYIVEKEKKTIDEMFEHGEEHFRDIESCGVEDVSKKERMIISTGGGVIKREKNIDCLKENGIIIFINRPIENIVSDVEVGTRPLLKDGKEKVYQLYEERYDLYKKYCDREVINDKNLEDVIEKIVEITTLLK